MKYVIFIATPVLYMYVYVYSDHSSVLVILLFIRTHIVSDSME